MIDEIGGWENLEVKVKTARLRVVAGQRTENMQRNDPTGTYKRSILDQ